MVAALFSDATIECCSLSSIRRVRLSDLRRMRALDDRRSASRVELRAEKKGRAASCFMAGAELPSLSEWCS